MERKERVDFFWTDELLDKAVRLRNSTSPLLPWKIVAERLRCDVRDLGVQLAYRASGRRKGFTQKWQEERAELMRMFLVENLSKAEIARKKCVSRAAVHQRLKRMGLDYDVREELGKEIKI